MDLTGHQVILTGQDPTDKFVVTFTVDGNEMSLALPQNVAIDKLAILKYINQAASDWLDAQKEAQTQIINEKDAKIALSAVTKDLTQEIGTDITDPTAVVP